MTCVRVSGALCWSWELTPELKDKAWPPPLHGGDSKAKPSLTEPTRVLKGREQGGPGGRGGILKGKAAEMSRTNEPDPKSLALSSSLMRSLTPTLGDLTPAGALSRMALGKKRAKWCQ